VLIVSALSRRTIQADVNAQDKTISPDVAGVQHRIGCDLRNRRGVEAGRALGRFFSLHCGDHILKP
jgi:hypothetical protein